MSGFSFFSNPIVASTNFSPFSYRTPAPPNDPLLASYLDKKVLVVCTDDRKIYGHLGSFDQHGNVVLEGACDRVIVGDLYCDVPLGIFVIRGEHNALIGELDLGKEELPQHMMCVSEEEIKMAQKAEKEAKDLKSTMMKRMGFLDWE